MILVSGLINIETTLQVEQFPLAYEPVRYPFFGVRTAVSGVGYNVARALMVLGSEVSLLGLLGADELGRFVLSQVAEGGLSAEHLLFALSTTPQSVILSDREGKRAIFTDLKEAQEQAYPLMPFMQAMEKASLAVLCNINWNRPMLEVARAMGKPIATDIHAIGDLHDSYNRDFMANATILFQSDEKLPCSAEKWIEQVQATYGTPLMVVGMGAKGALLGVRATGQLHHLPAVAPRPVVSTVGAGDALFACFLHFYLRYDDPLFALQKAVYFAGHKIGEVGGAQGFIPLT